MLKSLLALAGIALLCQAQAEPAWFLEFEFTYSSPQYNDRLLEPRCGAVVPLQYVQLYALDPRPGWTVSCGNEQPMFLLALGRECWAPKRLRNLTFDCVYRHFSAPRDSHEVTFDSIGVRGRFRFGR